MDDDLAKTPIGELGLLEPAGSGAEIWKNSTIHLDGQTLSWPKAKDDDDRQSD